jgi:ParB family chromosome partitioning protein
MTTSLPTDAEAKGKKPPTAKKSLSGLSNVSSLLNETPGKAPSGEPLQLDLSLVDDDPNNRKFVSEKDILEIAADMRENGQKEPISVRKNPDAPGRYIVNSGHTRKKGAIINGWGTIKGFIDDDFDEYDNIRVNIYRSNLDPRDMRDFVARELAKKVPKGDIAKRLGKSASWLSQYVRLTELPAPLADLFESGQCSDVTVINDLSRLYNSDPDEVAKFVTHKKPNRDNVVELSEFIKAKNKTNETEDHSGSDETPEELDEEQSQQTDKKPQKHKEVDILQIKKPLIVASYMGDAVHILFKKRPQQGHFWIKMCSSGEELEVPAEQLTLVELIDASEK